MSKWLENTLKQAEQLNDWLSPKREQSLAALRQTPWPNRKTEAWKYTSLIALNDAEFTGGSASVNHGAIEGLESIDVVFINGELQSTPQDLPEGLSIVSLKEADEQQKQWALEVFASVKPQHHIFGLVNDVLANSGVLIDVLPEAVISQPIRLVHQVTAGNEAHTRTVVRVGEHAKVSVVEHFLGDQQGFNTGFVEYAVAESAKLEHYRLALQGQQMMSIGGSHFDLSDHAVLNSTVIGLGSELSRIDIDINHKGEHAHAKLNAIYLLDGSELFDLHSCIEHIKPNGTTEENVRGIVADQARAVFNGRIHIHRDAQKTLAELNNRNLLMSREAEINTKPELEIYADDVRCAHGATVAEIDQKALYYLCSRGVSRQQAQVMLNFGFINELVDQMPNQVLAEWLRPILRERFANMDVK